MSFPSLKSRNDFETFRKERSRIPRLDGRFLRVVRLQDKHRCLFGFKIGRNTGNAVKRHRIRRVLRGAIALRLKQQRQFPKGLYLIIVKQSIRDISDRKLSLEIRTDLSKIFRKIEELA